VIWKAIIKAFPLIENGLAWNIGNGNRVKIGLDPWSSSDGNHLLTEQLIQSLHSRDFYFLSSVADTNHATLWAQGWKDPFSLGLNEEISQELEHFIQGLKAAQIHLSNIEDELIWDFAPSRSYTPKLGYLKC
jgi:hypothetical protein